jgi:hypothetical protein
MNVFKHIFFTVTFLFISIESKAQFVETGKVIDSIQSSVEPSISYSLYLPSNYSSELKYPVLYVFEPAGRADYILSHLKSAAESYGYILACSPDIKNGSINEMLQRSETLIRDVEHRWSINTKRRYAAGLSGGSRMAATVASITNVFEGVIGCGAGQPLEKSHQTDSSHTYTYYGFTGDEDYNYNEMVEQHKMLNDLGLSNRLHIFKGAHQWPKQNEMLRAFEWMELHAMKKGIKETDLNYIDSIFINYKYQLNVMDMRDELIDLADSYESGIELFAHWKDISGMQQKLDFLIETEEFFEAFELFEGVNEYESTLMEEIKSILVTVDFYGKILNPEFSNWNSILKEIQTLSKNSTFELLSKRLRSFMYHLSLEMGTQKFRDLEFKEARNYFTLQKRVYSQDPAPLISISKCYLMEGNQKNAIKNLDKAIKLGFTDYNYILNSSDFRNLEQTDKYWNLMSKMGYIAN